MAERRAYTDAEIDAADRRRSATRSASRRRQRSSRRRARSCSASSTRRCDAADWFGSAAPAEVLEAAGKADTDERLRAVRTLLAEETRVSMLIGVAVGYELATRC